MQTSRFLLVIVVTSLAVACGGQAQQTAATAPAAAAGTSLTATEEPEVTVEPLGLTIEEIEEDTDLYNTAGEEVGDIDSVLLDATGRPAAISADVGSYVGNEERIVVIGLDRLRVDEDDDLVTTFTNDELLRLPTWEG